jgi:dTDP-4-amino-4,6-dideoxygalactose transaminase
MCNHLYVVRVPQRAAGAGATEGGGDCQRCVLTPNRCILTQPCRQLGGPEGDFPQAEQASRETLAIPLYPE